MDRKKKYLTTKKEKQKKRKRFFVIGSIITLLFVFFSFAYHPHFFIEPISLKGDISSDEDTFLNAIREYLDEPFLYVFKKGTIFFFKSHLLERFLLEEFPFLQEVDVSFSQKEGLVVEFKKKKVHSLWCFESSENKPEECYFSDTKGSLYKKTPLFSDALFMKFYKKIGPSETIIGSQALPPQDFRRFFSFLAYLSSEFDFGIRKVFFEDFQDVRIVVYRFGNQFYEEPYPLIRYNRDLDYNSFLRNLEATLETEVFKKDFSNRPEKLRLLDFRFPRRVIYIFDEEKKEL